MKSILIILTIISSMTSYQIMYSWFGNYPKKVVLALFKDGEELTAKVLSETTKCCQLMNDYTLNTSLDDRYQQIKVVIKFQDEDLKKIVSEVFDTRREANDDKHKIKMKQCSICYVEPSFDENDDSVWYVGSWFDINEETGKIEEFK